MLPGDRRNNGCTRDDLTSGVERQNERRMNFRPPINDKPEALGGLDVSTY